MKINSNIVAINTYAHLTKANQSKKGSLTKLSSGLRINQAIDDAAGLSISEKMKNRISGSNQALRNVQDGISLIQTAEGGLNEMHSILNKMRDLSIQAANDTYNNNDLKAIQSEVDDLKKEIERITRTTQFNGKNLLDGTVKTCGCKNISSFTFQIGSDADETLTIKISAMGTSHLGEKNAKIANLDIVQSSAIGVIDEAIEQISKQRTNLGAHQNRLNYTSNTLSSTMQNLSEAHSRIRDVDMADEMMSFTKANIFSQVSTAMLAQANQLPQGVLQLLG
ncbi:flagellin [Marinilactibacillus kalidii]|uniref:flagellin N-terminal helical domain-containing protein n=1 Tax=Marinilactibacillus kalidii TaxID=2820274 RepID=UPI001ABEA386|nr:flagellin [Marinilactibacillus kalidii]